MISLEKKLKLLTVRFPIKTRDIFERLEWLEGLVKLAPAGTRGYILSTKDLSEVNKACYAKVRFANAEQAKRGMELFEMARKLTLFNSPAMALGCIIYIVEE